MGLTLKEYAGLEFCRGSPLGISCEIWLTWQTHREVGILKIYHWHWFLATFLSVVYLCLSYGLFVPDWQFEALSSAEATGSTLYMVDIHGFKRSTAALEWMGKHSLCNFVLVSSNLAIIAIQGFYWKSPRDNLDELNNRLFGCSNATTELEERNRRLFMQAVVPSAALFLEEKHSHMVWSGLAVPAAAHF
ncbi:hypothetical protein SAY86_007603 [Trapa natans]|uniref:Uncharacterized protein n=1 Tax=Trapa natans TaxID=22666 RepID=A0AAN7QX49_TRANT|nr:hypothetical protein SAY86_007603 [Trapa natans]